MVLSLGFRSGVPWNAPEYANPKLDELLNKAEATLDIEERHIVMKEIELLMQEDGLIARPVWRSLITAYDKRGKGFKMHTKAFIFAHELDIESQPPTADTRPEFEIPGDRGIRRPPSFGNTRTRCRAARTGVGPMRRHRPAMPSNRVGALSGRGLEEGGRTRTVPSAAAGGERRGARQGRTCYRRNEVTIPYPERNRIWHRRPPGKR